MTEEALAQAVIGAVGDLDGPLAPDAKGWEAMRRWLVQESPEMRQEWRAEVLATTKQDFADFGDRLAKLHSNNENDQMMNCVVFSSKQALEDANKAILKDEKKQKNDVFELVELL